MSARPRSAHQRGAILIESLIALALLSLGAAAMFRALDHFDAVGYAATRLGDEARAQFDQTEAR